MLVLLSGVSGAGKDTVKQELIKRNKNVESLPSYTDRAPRNNDIPGVTYNFVTTQEFERMIEQGELYEYSKHHEHYYGTSKKLLNEKINKELKDLEMKNAKFNVLMKKNNDFLENGIDDIEFMIRTNIGDEEKALIKIASGGEVSRIMLAIKTVLADTDKVPVMIFDEIDTGISGKAAKSVAEKMKIISKKHQSLCITHLPVIAAQGNNNYFIYKKVEEGKTKTNIKLLNEEETIFEIARISNGNITEVAIENAKELRKAV
mgnify:CR=1 FL=1